MNKNIKPFVKWAGGKRQLVNILLEKTPKKINTYYEPFVGGGALLFALQHKNSVINDLNKELIHLYLTIKQEPYALIEEITSIDNMQNEPYKEYYYSLRTEFNRKLLNNEYDLRLAGLFLYINKHSFNGLYRVNKQGAFNVPFNNSTGASFEKENIIEVSKYLQYVKITNLDFEQACLDASKADFVFLDSPYAPLKSTSFDSYTKTGFLQEDHIRLANLFQELDRRECYCILTNHNTNFIRDLYAGYTIIETSVNRMINADASNRKGTELIITNCRL